MSETCIIGQWIKSLCPLLLVVIFLVVIKVYNVLTLGVCKCKNRMDGKTVLVTGANRGIGKETAKDLARRGARVIMACRNMDSANIARDEIIKETGNNSILVHNVDLSSMASVRKFAKEILSTESRLDVLIHNAGVALIFRKSVTAEGLETTMATNYYGPFLLTHLLIDLLKKTQNSRIVVVSSHSYQIGTVDLQNLNPVSSCPLYVYFVSKYANILFTRELACRLQGTGITANCLHPGVTDSSIWKNLTFPLYLPIKLVVKVFCKSPLEGAHTTIHLAVSDKVEGISGKYFSDCKEQQLLERIEEDTITAKKLWELSEETVGLTESDPHIS